MTVVTSTPIELAARMLAPVDEAGRLHSEPRRTHPCALGLVERNPIDRHGALFAGVPRFCILSFKTGVGIAPAQPGKHPQDSNSRRAFGADGGWVSSLYFATW